MSRRQGSPGAGVVIHDAANSLERLLGIPPGSGPGARSPAGMSSKSRSVVRELLSAMSARLLVLPVAAVAAIFTTRLVNAALGPQSFAVYSLVAGLPLLFAVADLGLGAAITNSAAAATTDPARFLAILRRSLLISLFIAFLIAAASTLLGAMGLWPSLLGLSESELNAPISLAMIVFAFAIPGGLGRAVLLGIGRYGPSVTNERDRCCFVPWSLLRQLDRVPLRRRVSARHMGRLSAKAATRRDGRGDPDLDSDADTGRGWIPTFSERPASAIAHLDTATGRRRRGTIDVFPASPVGRSGSGARAVAQVRCSARSRASDWQ